MQTEVFLRKLIAQGLKQETLDKTEALGIPNPLLCGLIMAESNGDAKAMRYEPHFKWLYRPDAYAKKHRITRRTSRELQKFSYGLCQLMGALGVEYAGLDRSVTDLLDPNINCYICACHLKGLKVRWKTWPAAISAYNQGSPRRKMFSKKFKNQKYVDKVINNARYFGW